MEPKRKPTRLRKRNLELKLNVTETKAPSTCYLLPLYLTFWGWLVFKESGETSKQSFRTLSARQSNICLLKGRRR